jgi:hypothetical protein
MSQLKYGMPKDDAISLLGKPDSMSGDAQGETATYDRIVAFGVREKFYVRFEGEHVVKYGSLGQYGPSAAQVQAMQNQMYQQQMMQQQNTQQLQNNMIQRQPVSCTSQQNGSMTYTNCR